MSTSPTTTTTTTITTTPRRGTNGVRVEAHRTPQGMPYYCPTSPNKDHQHAHQRRAVVDDEAIDPQLRSISGASTSAPGISTMLVPAHFPSAEDDPHGEDDLEDTSNTRTPRARRTRRATAASRGDGAGVPANGNGAGNGRARRRSFDDSENPFAPPAEALEHRADGRPVFNHELYPGYDEFGNRRGLEHLRGGVPPSNTGSYYRPRVHHYDGPPPRNGGGAGQLVVPPAVDYAAIHQQSAQFGGGGGSVNPALLVPAPAPGPTFPSGREKTLHEILGLEPGTPISLDSLTDPEEGMKPEYTYATLVKLAIYASPQKKLTLQEIYEAIEKRFEWFRKCENPNAWKTSIRHSLSLLAAFQKVPRHVTDPGKGHYWTVDFSKGEGNKRIRKRNKKPPKGSAAGKKQNDAERRANGQRSSNSTTRDTSQSAQEDPETEAELSDSDGYIDPQLRQRNARAGASMARTTGAVRRGSLNSGQNSGMSMSRIPIHAPSATAHAGTSLSASLRLSARAAARTEPYPRPPSTASTVSSLGIGPGPSDHLRYYRRRAAMRGLDEDYDDECSYDEDMASVGSTSFESTSVGSPSMDLDLDLERDGPGERDMTMSVSSSGVSSRSPSTPPTTDPHSNGGPISIPSRFGRPAFDDMGLSYGMPPGPPTNGTSYAGSRSHTNGFGAASATSVANGRHSRPSSLSLSSTSTTSVLSPLSHPASLSTSTSTSTSTSAPRTAASGFLSHAARTVSFTSAAAAASGGPRSPVFGKRDKEREDIVMIDAGGLPAARRVSPRKRATLTGN